MASRWPTEPGLRAITPETDIWGSVEFQARFKLVTCSLHACCVLVAWHWDHGFGCHLIKLLCYVYISKVFPPYVSLSLSLSVCVYQFNNCHDWLQLKELNTYYSFSRNPNPKFLRLPRHRLLMEAQMKKIILLFWYQIPNTKYQITERHPRWWQQHRTCIYLSLNMIPLSINTWT